MDWQWSGAAGASEEDFLRAAMEWHFSPDTGSDFWLRRRPYLGFDPVRDIRAHADLARFPEVAGELRGVRPADLVPRGYAGRERVVGAYESGGTTGVPKTVLLLEDWLEASLAWKSDRLDELGFPRSANWLILAPSGPHIFGRLMVELAARRGGVPFTVDLDPRWVRRCLARGDVGEADRYSEHLIEQARTVLESQEIGVLVATPPLLELMLRHDELVAHINATVEVIMWGGAHLSVDARRVLQEIVFPEVTIRGQYGNTLILGGSMERPGHHGDHGAVVFDSFAPYTTFSVVDPETRSPVREGERGQVVMHHISKCFLLPNNVERDMATAVASPTGAFGWSVADVTPLKTFDDAVVIEGVY